ncbi:MAG: biotin--[acetyl-CoA-carboxylase] ligase [Lentisphaerae bacterium]|nr:MAG: biotin--[acetyl-CoA-carboxylase] ligase [Lentisphaerota bacterium]
MIIRLPCVDSTNSYVLKHATQLDHLTLVTADEQTAGRGRFQRKWYSPPGQNFYGTLLIKDLPPHCQPHESMATLAMAALATLQQEGRLHRAWLKWPNDIYVGHAKLAGLLAESAIIEKHTVFAIGLGVNLNMPQAELAKIDKPATSYLNETGKSWSPPDFTQNLYQQILHYWQRLTDHHHEFIEEWIRLSPLPGKQVTIDTGQERLCGKVLSIQPDGTLRLQLPDGTSRNFICGDVSLTEFTQ